MPRLRIQKPYPGVKGKSVCEIISDELFLNLDFAKDVGRSRYCGKSCKQMIGRAKGRAREAKLLCKRGRQPEAVFAMAESIADAHTAHFHATIREESWRCINKKSRRRRK